MKTLLFVMAMVISISSAKAIDSTVLFESMKQKVFTVRDYSADVKMKINVHYMKVPTLKGKMYFKSPDKLRLERRGGLSLMPKKNINLTLSNLIPTGKVTVIDLGYVEYHGKKMHVIKVIPDDDNSTIILAKLWIDESELLAVRTETTTRNDGTIAMEMVYGKYKEYALPDNVTIFMNLKEFKLPEGITMDYNKAPEPAQATPAKDTKGTIQITYLDYQINKGLSSSIFDGK
jgi:hypothetical protein